MGSSGRQKKRKRDKGKGQFRQPPVNIPLDFETAIEGLLGVKPERKEDQRGEAQERAGEGESEADQEEELIQRTGGRLKAMCH